MLDRSRRRRTALVAALVVALVGCGETPTDQDGGVEPLPPPGPFNAFDIFLRPLSIQRPSPTGGTPAPALAAYNLTAFYRGGTLVPTFTWTVPAELGRLEPKGPGLSTSDPTVLLRIRDDGRPPLGFHDLSAAGLNGSETSTARRRIAVVQNTWQKHRRAYFRGTEPDDLIQWPVFWSAPGTPASADTIFYVEGASPTTIRLRRIPAFRNLAGPEANPEPVILEPLVPDERQLLEAAKTTPDVSPSGLGRREILFASSMDTQYPQRCPGAGSCENKPPLNLWVGHLPLGDAPYTPQQLTLDSTYVEFGRTKWFAFNYESPRWDPRSTGARARIAFLSDKASGLNARRKDLWTADLVDNNGDSRSDELSNYHRLTTSGGIGGFAWHPTDGRIFYFGPGGFSWVDAASGAVTPVGTLDSTLTRFAFPTIFARPGEHTLVAFQAQSENLVNLYVYDEQDGTLSKLLPFSVPVTHNMYPRWHPTRKQLAYVSDYTVEAWANSTENRDGVPDRLNPRAEEQYGMRRTYYPSIWVLQLED